VHVSQQDKQRKTATVSALLAQEGSWLPAWQTACLNGAVSTDSVDTLKVLVEHGFDCSGTVGPRRSSLLHIAAAYSSTACVAVLIQQSCDVHATDNDGNTPLAMVTLPELHLARK
jgi:ankyrin repeat protein